MSEPSKPMFTQQIEIGSRDHAEVLYAYPNNPALGWSLEETIVHWVSQTIERDGYSADITPSVTIDANTQTVTLVLQANKNLPDVLMGYSRKLTQIYAAGLIANYTDIPKIKADGKWDPRSRNWRFFMPMGLPMVNARALQFFHYPPEKMLNNLQNYLNDPVPYRVENLLMALGEPDRASAQHFECIVDGAPIAAPDDAGSAEKHSKWGYIPINYFKNYQKAMIAALLNPHPNYPGWTVPIVVYGNHPNEIFSEQFLNCQPLGQNKPRVIEILPGLKTPVIGSKHPYGFYWTAQVGSDNSPLKVGTGKMLPQNCQRAYNWMISDLVSTGWMLGMSKDPTQDPNALVTSLNNTWTSASKANTVCALVQSEATLYYKDAAETDYAFRVSAATAAGECANHGDNTCSFIA